MKVVFCWRGISGYMAACWKALDRLPGIDVHVICYDPASRQGTNTLFDAANLLGDLSHDLLSFQEMSDKHVMTERVTAQHPDTVVISGWANAAANGLLQNSKLRNSRFVMTMDTPWQGTLRQHIGRLVLKRYVHRYDAVVVAGERTWQYARRLGVPEEKLFRYLYGVDYDLFAPCLAERCKAASWPRSFLYVGRYVEPKGLGVLMDAYAAYRKHVTDPWTLNCCGMGPLSHRMQQSEGVTDQGFIQPSDLPARFIESGAFVLPSQYEPWGVVLAEAAASGLPLICSEACGAGLDVMRHGWNGYGFATASQHQLCRMLLEIHNAYDNLEQMGKRSQVISEAVGAKYWADRWAMMFKAFDL